MCVWHVAWHTSDALPRGRMCGVTRGSFGKGENSRELAIEPANSHDLISSILLMAKWA